MFFVCFFYHLKSCKDVLEGVPGKDCIFHVCGDGCGCSCASSPVLCVDSYTHNIEAVSCDEALVDITEILAETKLTPDEFASAVRMEIRDQTHCAASVGIG